MPLTLASMLSLTSLLSLTTFAVRVSPVTVHRGVVKGSSMPAEGVRTVRSFCRVCTSVCGILVEVDGDVVTRVRGDREHPLSQGYTCPKGRALPQMHHHPDRIERPQMRIDGQLRDTTWEACLDDLGARIRSVIERHGPGSLGIFFGTGVGMDATGTRGAEAVRVAR